MFYYYYNSRHITWFYDCGICLFFSFLSQIVEFSPFVGIGSHNFHLIPWDIYLIMYISYEKLFFIKFCFLCIIIIRLVFEMKESFMIQVNFFRKEQYKGYEWGFVFFVEEIL